MKVRFVSANSDRWHCIFRVENIDSTQNDIEVLFSLRLYQSLVTEQLKLYKCVQIKSNQSKEKSNKNSPNLIYVQILCVVLVILFTKSNSKDQNFSLFFSNAIYFQRI